MNEALHVLVVDDEPRIRTMVRRYLTEEGLKVSEAGDGATMRQVLEQESVDLVLLDLVMPGEDGLSLAREIRRHSEIPIIMVTGKGDLIDRVVGLEAGADDYIAKPFHLREVLARIRTVSRRTRGPAAPAAPAVAAPATETENNADTLAFEGWTLDVLRRDLRAPDGRPVPLTAAEFELLRVFLHHPNRVLSRDRLMDLAKGRDWAAYDRTIDTQVMRLRKKIEADPANPSLVKTVRGAGYLFAAAVRPA
ncbi:DNA-binding response regulator [Thalassobaculum fulvum]|jgi:two-component system phosphate regulon response regulator OmpR|uniref:Regulatory protein VirG n=1 Tax=Thalassobaculum fulvum TaxID=1633335 RepID=A0A918XWB3_9PROT|nr:response regulator [Thalassobaculum fulvum]GHD61163.1 DNA-binding response regulator [Thalassobaculum fulvum]